MSKEEKITVDYPEFLLEGFNPQFFSKMMRTVFSQIDKPTKPKNPNVTILGEGYELHHLVIKDFDNRNEYSHLYKDGRKLSNTVFRKGGIGGNFKEGFCNLIEYNKSNKKGEKFDFGTHAIVNKEGKVALRGEGLDNPYIVAGCIGKCKDNFYNLNTGEIIITSSGTTINCEEHVYLENRYSFSYYKKPMEKRIV